MESGEYKAITTQSTSTNSAVVVDDVVLDTTQTTRRILKTEIVNNPENPDSMVKITIKHQRKTSDGEWQDADSFRLSSLRAGEEIQLALNTQQTKILYDALSDYYSVGNQGVQYGTQSFVAVDDPDALVLSLLLPMINAREDDVFDILSECKPRALMIRGLQKIHETRCIAVDVFNTHLGDEDWNENQWQSFFEQNQWILGQGLDYRFLSISQTQYNGPSILDNIFCKNKLESSYEKTLQFRF